MDRERERERCRKTDKIYVIVNTNGKKSCDKQYDVSSSSLSLSLRRSKCIIKKRKRKMSHEKRAQKVTWRPEIRQCLA